MVTILKKEININGKVYVYDSKRNYLFLPDEFKDEANYMHPFKIEYNLEKNELKDLASNSRQHLIVCITESCNMRCRYCGYHYRYDGSASLSTMSIRFYHFK